MNPLKRTNSIFWLLLGGSILIATPPVIALLISWVAVQNMTGDGMAAIGELLVIGMATAVPISVVLAAGLTILIVVPMRQVDRNLRRLGSGEFERSMAIKGPRDVAELGERLDWLRRRLMQLENQKLDFVRHISHELKTPLTTIREGSELLLDDSGQQLDPESAEIAEIMRESALALEKLITDLLQFGRNVAPSRALPEYEQVDLGQLLRVVLGDQAIATYAKRLRIESHLKPASLFCHRDQLKAVLDNLLSNAIKYSPDEGTIVVRSGTEAAGVFVSVQDSGPGIKPEERERIFEPFYRGSAPVQGHVKGTGLGLSIARQYADAHDGRVDILDHDGGALVRVILPANEPVLAANGEDSQ
jgi:two-component system sensor histidine kinase GlrK